MVDARVLPDIDRSALFLISCSTSFGSGPPGGRMGREAEDMAMALDHLILPVNDLEASLRFYTEVLGLTYMGEREPFSVVRITPACTIQLAPWGTPGGGHLAFAMTQDEFENAFRRIREAGLEYGDSFDSVGNMKGPGEAEGARGSTRSLYCFDPSKHLIELAYYEGSN